MAELRDLPPGLRVYLLAVITVGTALVGLVGLVAATGPASLDGGGWARVALLLALGALAERCTLHLTHKTAINVSTAASLAAVLVFPVGLPGVLALSAGALGQLARRKGAPIEAGFNASCRGLAALAAALVYHAVRDLPHTGPDVAGFGGLGALLATAVAANAVTTLAVAVAAGLQLGTNPLRIVAITLGDDAAPEAAMTVMAIPVAFLTLQQPVLVPTLALPLVLVYVSIRGTVRLREDTQRALTALVDVVELRDPYTAGHSHRVAALARALALQVGLTDEEADLIEGAGRVHDLGKVAIDPLVLTKPGKLTAAEYDEIKRHPVLGADVVARFADYRVGVPLVRHHHERWDGAGYPDGLAGERIPLGARILAVADTYDALTSTRAYRDAKPAAVALRILVEGAGTQWDPRVVDALVAHLGPAAAPIPARPTPVGVALPA